MSESVFGSSEYTARCRTDESHRSYMFSFFFVFDSKAWHVEPSQPGMELVAPVLEAQSLNHWTTRKALFSFLGQFSSVAQSCPTLCDPMNCSTPGLPVHHQLPEFTETHVHRVSDAIRPSHPLSSPSPPAPNPS